MRVDLFSEKVLSPIMCLWFLETFFALFFSFILEVGILILDYKSLANIKITKKAKVWLQKFFFLFFIYHLKIKLLKIMRDIKYQIVYIDAINAQSNQFKCLVCLETGQHMNCHKKQNFLILTFFE